MSAKVCSIPDVEPHHGPKIEQGTSPVEKHMIRGEGGEVVEMASWDVIILFCSHIQGDCRS